MNVLLRRVLPIRRAGAGVPMLVRSGFLGLSDQVVISATNFATMVLLARVLGPSEFGAFVLVITGLLFATSIQYCLISQPHHILAASQDRDDYVRYTSSTAGQQFLLAAAFAVLALSAAGVVRLAGWGGATLLLVFAPVVFAWQFQEFTRRVFYTEGRLVTAIANDVVSYGGQVVGLVILWRLGHLSAVTGLAVIGITSATAAALGAWQLRSRFSLGHVRHGAAYRENWKLGKWLLGGNLASWTSGQLYPLLAAAFVGLAATGAMRAMQTILGPTNVLLIGMDTALTPAAARAYSEGGPAAVRAMVTKVYAYSWPFMAAYCVGVAVFARPILRLVYGEQFLDYSWLLPVFALTHALTYLHTPISLALRGSRLTSPMLQAYVMSTAVVFTLGIAAVYFFGVAGAAMGMIAHGIIVNAVLWRRFHQAQEPAAPRSEGWSAALKEEMAVIK